MKAFECPECGCIEYAHDEIEVAICSNCDTEMMESE